MVDIYCKLEVIIKAYVEDKQPIKPGTVIHQALEWANKIKHISQDPQKQSAADKQLLQEVEAFYQKHFNDMVNQFRTEQPFIKILQQKYDEWKNRLDYRDQASETVIMLGANSRSAYSEWKPNDDQMRTVAGNIHAISGTAAMEDLRESLPYLIEFCAEVKAFGSTRPFPDEQLPKALFDRYTAATAKVMGQQFHYELQKADSILAEFEQFLSGKQNFQFRVEDLAPALRSHPNTSHWLGRVPALRIALKKIEERFLSSIDTSSKKTHLEILKSIIAIIKDLRYTAFDEESKMIAFAREIIQQSLAHIRQQYKTELETKLLKPLNALLAFKPDDPDLLKFKAELESLVKHIDEALPASLAKGATLEIILMQLTELSALELELNEDFQGELARLLPMAEPLLRNKQEEGAAILPELNGRLMELEGQIGSLLPWGTRSQISESLSAQHDQLESTAEALRTAFNQCGPHDFNRMLELRSQIDQLKEKMVGFKAVLSDSLEQDFRDKIVPNVKALKKTVEQLKEKVPENLHSTFENFESALRKLLSTKKISGWGDYKQRTQLASKLNTDYEGFESEIFEQWDKIIQAETARLITTLEQRLAKYTPKEIENIERLSASKITKISTLASTALEEIRALQNALNDLKNSQVSSMGLPLSSFENKYQRLENTRQRMATVEGKVKALSAEVQRIKTLQQASATHHAAHQNSSGKTVQTPQPGQGTANTSSTRQAPPVPQRQRAARPAPAPDKIRPHLASQNNQPTQTTLSLENPKEPPAVPSRPRAVGATPVPVNISKSGNSTTPATDPPKANPRSSQRYIPINQRRETLRLDFEKDKARLRELSMKEAARSSGKPAPPVNTETHGAPPVPTRRRAGADAATLKERNEEIRQQSKAPVSPESSPRNKND